ncbi:hypothetical protein NPIL_220321 [Nephila pilipes]|uniref:Uncharacterized protein n=1 Tax=Nephila pilipes TaxID=299642 RepID=A0A8X6QUD3_NEPPI|nr:hypothetical protein NPIL_220321 [Nephila pilipes]
MSDALNLPGQVSVVFSLVQFQVYASDMVLDHAGVDMARYLLCVLRIWHSESYPSYAERFLHFIITWSQLTDIISRKGSVSSSHRRFRLNAKFLGVGLLGAILGAWLLGGFILHLDADKLKIRVHTGDPV